MYIEPDFSEPMRANVSRDGSFAATLPVPAQAELGPQWVFVWCRGGGDDISGDDTRVSVTVVPAKVVTTTTKPEVSAPVLDDVGPTATDTQTLSAQPTAAESELGGAGIGLVVFGLLAAVGVAVVAVRRILVHPADPVPDRDQRPQRVRVHVVADPAPSTRIRAITRVPEVRVRVTVGASRLSIKEFPA